MVLHYTLYKNSLPEVEFHEIFQICDSFVPVRCYADVQALPCKSNALEDKYSMLFLDYDKYQN